MKDGGLNILLLLVVISISVLIIVSFLYQNTGIYSYLKGELATIGSFSGTPVDISECGNLTDQNAIYNLQSDVSSNGTCFNFLANNITLNGNNYTINYSQTESGYGIQIGDAVKANLINMSPTSYNFLSNSTFSIENSYGRIEFLNPIVGNGVLTDVKINDNFAIVNVGNNAGLNKSAIISLYNIGDRGYNNIAILYNGKYRCNETTTPSCYNFTSLSVNNVIFNVTGWSNYSIGEYVSIVNTSSGNTSTPPSSSEEDDEPLIYLNGTNSTCPNSWVCGVWDKCTNGIQKRDCFDLSNCVVKKDKPATNQSCTVEKVKELETPAVEVNKTGQNTTREYAGKIFYFIIAIILVMIVLVGYGIIYFVRKNKRK